METQIKMARLNADYNRKKNEISKQKQILEAAKQEALQMVDQEYHAKKRDLLSQIAEIRRKKKGLSFDDAKRYDLTDEIRNIEDQLNIIHDERDIKARKTVHEKFAKIIELENESSKLDEWLADEKIKIMEEQRAAKIAQIKEEAEHITEIME